MTRVDGAREITVHLVLHTLTRNGTEFDPVVDLRGYDEFVRACRDGGGVLLAAPHTALGLFVLRMLHKDGVPSITITGEPDERIPGTRVTAVTLQPSPTFLVATRNRLRAGMLMCAMLDRAEHRAKRTFEVDTANGPVIVAPALLQVAAQCGARVFFIEIHVERARLSGTIAAASSDSAEGLAREFIDFVRAHVDARFGPRLQRAGAS
jgi:hypothetical protein